MSCDTVEDDVECVHAEVIMLNADGSNRRSERNTMAVFRNAKVVTEEGEDDEE